MFLIYTIIILNFLTKSTPIVVRKLLFYVLSSNLKKRDDFPTLPFPINNSWMDSHMFGLTF